MLDSFSEQLAPEMVEILSHAFASHVLRMHLLVLAASPNFSSLRKRDDTSQNTISSIFRGFSSASAFQDAMDRLIAKLASDLNGATAQSLALSATASPALQIIVGYELDSKGAMPITSLLLPDDDVTFAQTMLSDSVGSRLMESVVSKCPGRIFKRLYKGIFNGHLAEISKRNTGAYVLVQAIARFNSENLEKALSELTPYMAELLEGSPAVITTLIEQCRKRGVGMEELTNSLGPARIHADVPVHVSILFQTMLSTPDDLRGSMMRKLIDLPQEELVAISKSRSASRIVQAALSPEQPSYLRKQVISAFLGKITELGQDNIASHVVDALWTGSSGLKFLRDRLVNEVLANEQVLRQTIPGRAVCRNWRKWSREFEDIPVRGIDAARKRHASAADNEGKRRMTQSSFKGGANSERRS